MTRIEILTKMLMSNKAILKRNEIGASNLTLRRMAELGLISHRSPVKQSKGFIQYWYLTEEQQRNAICMVSKSRY